MTADISQDVFIGRQPILDRARQLYAYELLFRTGSGNHASVTDNVVATAAVLNNVFSEIGLHRVLGPCLGFINVDADFLGSDVLELLPAKKIVLEVLETVRITPQVVERCEELRRRGFLIALDDVIGLTDEQKLVLPHVDIVKIDIQALPTDELAQLARALRPWGVRLLAEKVDSEEQAAHCSSLGFDLFQGYFFARPAIIATRKLDSSQTTLLRLLGLVLQDADAKQLEPLFKQEPALLMNLMRLTNSVACGLRHPVSSLRQALTMLGQRQLQRWLQLLLYAQSGRDARFPNPLLMVAATRARCMELLAARAPGGGQELADHAFLTGILSMMPALLQKPLAEILAPLPLPPHINQALHERAGKLGKLLLLAEAVEHADAPASAALCGELHISDTALARASAEAMAWAGELGVPQD
ncbi:MAG: EAL domain-containing protein [Rhodocyclaceae bacterium]|nr:EAL domain-containing protein [Rhodocyclaceae bacterium]MBX3669758.1 EAL domain-containing protein [Rhodocyclaceae bacterium]